MARKKLGASPVLWLAGSGVAAWAIYTYVQKQSAAAQAAAAAANAVNTGSQSTTIPGSAADTAAPSQLVAHTTASQDAAGQRASSSRPLTASVTSALTSQPTFGLLR